MRRLLPPGWLRRHRRERAPPSAATDEDDGQGPHDPAQVVDCGRPEVDDRLAGDRPITDLDSDLDLSDLDLSAHASDNDAHVSDGHSATDKRSVVRGNIIACKTEPKEWDESESAAFEYREEAVKDEPTEQWFDVECTDFIEDRVAETAQSEAMGTDSRQLTDVDEAEESEEEQHGHASEWAVMKEHRNGDQCAALPAGSDLPPPPSRGPLGTSVGSGAAIKRPWEPIGGDLVGPCEKKPAAGDRDPARLPRCLGCSVCDRTFGHPSHLKNHMKTHSTERPHACGPCGLAFRLPSELKRHQRLQHEPHTKKYRCYRCGAKFEAQPDLKQHLREHSSALAGPRTCDDCGRTFFGTTALERHRAEHVQEAGVRIVAASQHSLIGYLPWAMPAAAGSSAAAAAAATGDPSGTMSFGFVGGWPPVFVPAAAASGSSYNSSNGQFIGIQVDQPNFALPADGSGQPAYFALPVDGSGQPTFLPVFEVADPYDDNSDCQQDRIGVTDGSASVRPAPTPTTDNVSSSEQHHDHSIAAAAGSTELQSDLDSSSSSEDGFDGNDTTSAGDQASGNVNRSTIMKAAKRTSTANPATERVVGNIKRYRFSDGALLQLHAAHQRQPHRNKLELQDLATELGLDPAKVATWFRNRNVRAPRFSVDGGDVSEPRWSVDGGNVGAPRCSMDGGNVSESRWSVDGGNVGAPRCSMDGGNVSESRCSMDGRNVSEPRCSMDGRNVSEPRRSQDGGNEPRTVQHEVRDGVLHDQPKPSSSGDALLESGGHVSPELKAGKGL